MLRILVKNPFFLNFEVAEDYYLYKKKIKIFVNNKKCKQG